MSVELTDVEFFEKSADHVATQFGTESELAKILRRAAEIVQEPGVTRDEAYQRADEEFTKSQS